MSGSEEDLAAALATVIERRAAGLARSGRLQEAAELLQELTARAPNHVRSRLLLARVLGQQGRYAEALAAVERVEGGECERLRGRLEALAARGGRAVRPWRMALIGAGLLTVATFVGGSLYAWLAAPHGATAVERSVRAAELESPASAVDRDAPTLEPLQAWMRLVQKIEPLPTAHRVHLRPEIRQGSAVAVLEGEVISESIARRILDAVAAVGIEVDLSGLHVADRHSVAAGDSLSLIARRVYGDGARWPAIWDANRKALSDPDQITPGMLLVIP